MREETKESRRKLSDFVRKVFGSNPNCRHKIEPTFTDMEGLVEQLEETEVPGTVDEAIQEPVLRARINYRNLKAPMTAEEMTVCMIPREWYKDKVGLMAIQQFQELFKRMDEFLEISRKISKEAVDSHRRLPSNVPDEFRVRRIQEQMRAIRFRLDIRDYNSKAEMEILKDRLYQLYQEAKVVDPEGTARYERMIDKQMRRAK